jgi:AraC-like DNA-binding protein
VSQDYDTIKKVLTLVAPALERNPRRIKQFINLFRLRVYIATETGLFDIPEGSDETALTLAQLGKFVAIQLKWPLLLVDLERYPTLIKELQLKALYLKKTEDMPELREVTRWSGRTDLMALLREGCVSDKGKVYTAKRREVSLENLNFEKLLQVSPKIRDIESLIETYEELEEDREPPKLTQLLGKSDKNKEPLTRISYKEGESLSSLEYDYVEVVVKKLMHLVEIEKVYCDEKLTLRSLAKKLQIPYYQLSEILNKKLHRKFNDFINYYRIEEAKRILQSSEAEDKTAFSIASEVGFNSATSFYQVFKKYTGMTPTRYRKEAKKEK